MNTNNDLRPAEIATDENDSAASISLSPIQLQQEYYENLTECDWVKYDTDNKKHLLQNIAFALFGSPSTEGDLLSLIDSESLEGYTSRQKEQVLNVYKKICEQGKYTQKNDILLSILLIVCAKPKPLKFYKLEPSNHWLDLHNRTDTDIWCTTVFKVRKCVPTSETKSCRVYIDENARVYKSWQAYLTNNTLPKCVIIAPENGEYEGVIIEGEQGYAVKLSVTPSPALGIGSKVLSSVDTASTVASLGAVGVLGVAAFTPVGPVIVGGAVVATIATGIYGLFRSSLHLHDRKIHEQSISLKEAEARGSWINIAASSVGLAAGAASTLLSRSAAAGSNLTKTGQVLTASVEFLRHANLFTGGAGVLNSLAHLIIKYRKHGEKATKLELFQFSASLLFFCHAAISNRTAQSIIEDAQAKTINEYRATLRSNRHRKIFDKISAESRRVAGAIQGNTEVICGIKSIANKDQYFADVLRINKDINEHKLRISMTADGRVQLNAAHKFDPSQLYGLGKESRAQLFASLGPAKLNTPNVSTKVSSSSVVQVVGNKEENDTIRVGIRPEEVLRIGMHLIRVSTSGAENIADLLENLSKDVYDGLMTVALNLISCLIPSEIAKLKLLSPDEDLLHQIVNFVFNYLKHQRPMGDASRESDDGIVIILKEFFQDGVVNRNTILFLKDRLLIWIDEEFDKQRREFPDKEPITCDVCNGIRYA